MPPRRIRPTLDGVDDHVKPLEQRPSPCPLAIPDGPAFGTFRHDLDRDEWRWSDEVYRIHGYEPLAVQPTSDLWLSHIHPEDLDRSLQHFTGVRTYGRPFSNYHRIIGADGKCRLVLTVGEASTANTPRGITLAAVTGYMIDLTEPVGATSSEAVARSAARRAVIEQAKGIVMATYQVSPDAAFAFLKRWSSTTQTKVAELSESIVEAYVQHESGKPAPALAEILDRLAAAN